MGRAERLRLRHRLDVATHGADVLERTLRVLRTEERVMLERRGKAERAWREAVRTAETWLRHAAVLGGQRGLTTAARDDAAQVDFIWAVTMGVRHPTGASCVVPERQDDEPPPAGTALLNAEAGYRAVLVAAAELAATQTATELLQREIDVTQRRARALRRHWVPTLNDALARCELALQEQEHEEWVRRRWVAQRRPGSAGR